MLNIQHSNHIQISSLKDGPVGPRKTSKGLGVVRTSHASSLKYYYT